ncbi:MAG: MarR family transcriptional regulator [Saprospiraceae bacterium]
MIQKSIEASIIQYVLEFAAQVKKGGDLQCQAYGITTQQWLILLHLANDPNVPFSMKRAKDQPVLASELADFFKVSRANITNLLSVLLDKKLIRQIEDSRDRRRKFLELTAEGEKVVNALEPLRNAANERLFSQFLPEEKALFFEYLQQCVKYLSTVLQNR